MTSPCRRNDAGVATVWTVVIVSGWLLMVGLVFDGGTVLRGRSTSFDVAGGAARAASQDLDQAALSQGLVVIDENAAASTAHAWLAAHDAEGDVVVEGNTVTVTVRQAVQLQILRPAQVTVSETVTSQAQHGRSEP